MSIQTLATVRTYVLAEALQLQELAAQLQQAPLSLRDALGKRKRPKHVRFNRHRNSIDCAYGWYDGYRVATAGDTVVVYEDGTFAILTRGI